MERSHTIPWWNLYSFLDTIKLSLDMKYPVIMGARDRNSSELHSFVCDGYRDNEYHFNWGWNGKYNGYYSFNFWGNINVHNQFVFSTDFDAIVFIHPDECFPNEFCNNTMHLEDFYIEYYNGHDYMNHKPYDNVPLTMATLYSSSIDFDESWRTIPNVAHVAIYQAYKDIYLQDGFVAEYGCDFTAKIDPCERCEERDITENATPLTDGADYGSHDNMNAPIAAGWSEDSDGLYPNPTDGQVTVATDGEVESIVIYTSDGRPVGGWKYITIGEYGATLDVGNLPAGAYILRIHTPRGVTAKKLTVRR